MSDTFDPFALPNSFNPLEHECMEPTGQSAYMRRGLAPTGQSACFRRGLAPDQRQLTMTADADAALHGGGTGGRLAHLLGPPGPASGQSEARPDDMGARLQALEDEVAILEAQLESFHATTGARLDDHMARLVDAVTALLDERLARRG